MTTLFPFTPRTVPPAPSFQPTLDGNVVTITLNVNLFGQRYYALCTDSTNTIIFNVPLIVSPGAVPIQTLTFDPTSLTATVTLVNPHSYSLGETVNLTIAGATPAGWNGTFLMLATGPNTLTFPLSSNPGTLQVAGTLSYLISICEGFFNSTLVFRNNQFEVNP
jgi:hypothetical protein